MKQEKGEVMSFMENLLKRIDNKIKNLNKEKSSLYDVLESNYNYETSYIDHRIEIILAKIDVLKEMIEGDE